MKWLKWLILVSLWTVGMYTAYDWLFDYELQMWDNEIGPGYWRLLWYSGILFSAGLNYFGLLDWMYHGDKERA